MNSRLAPALLALTLTTGCPDPDEDGDDELGETDETETTDTTDTEGEPDLHGVVQIELGAADPSVFEGTSQISALVSYGPCLQDFYESQHPELTDDQPEGAAVFGAWLSELCDPAREKNIACSVTTIEQTLIEATAVYTLKVTYAVDDPASLHERRVHVGPIPLPEAADCPSPYVELGVQGVRGFDSQGAQIWGHETVTASNAAIADQATPLLIDVVPEN